MTGTQEVPHIFGEVLFDCFPDGSRVLGGAPFNVAWHLQAFGQAPLFISRVGDDPMGREIRAAMQSWGMSTAALQKDSAHPTGEVRVSLTDGQPSFNICADRAYDHIQADALPPAAAALYYHGSLGLRDADAAATLERLLAERPAPVFLDVNLRPPWWQREPLMAWLDRAQWVKINDQELEILAPGPEGLQAKAAALVERHLLGLAIVTRGAEGAFAVDQHGALVEVAPEGRAAVVDTVGAGDAFASVCILGLRLDWPLSQTLERAQRFAAAIVGRRGATVDDPGFYRPFFEDWQLGYYPQPGG